MEKSKLDAFFEIYKCIALTAIAVLLLAIFSRMPTMITPEQIQQLSENEFDFSKFPAIPIRSYGGSVSINGEVEIINSGGPLPVNVTNDVGIEQSSPIRVKIEE